MPLIGRGTMGLPEILLQTLVFSMSAPDACVHIVDGSQVELPYNADPLVFQAAKYSRIRAIKTDPP